MTSPSRGLGKPVLLMWRAKSSLPLSPFHFKRNADLLRVDLSPDRSGTFRRSFPHAFELLWVGQPHMADLQQGMQWTITSANRIQSEYGPVGMSDASKSWFILRPIIIISNNNCIAWHGETLPLAELGICCRRETSTALGLDQTQIRREAHIDRMTPTFAHINSQMLLAVATSDCTEPHRKWEEICSPSNNLPIKFI